MNLQLDIKVTPFAVPDFVILDEETILGENMLTLLFPDADNNLHIPLDRLTQNDVEKLCQEFKVAVFEKAGITLPVYRGN